MNQLFGYILIYEKLIEINYWKINYSILIYGEKTPKRIELLKLKTLKKLGTQNQKPNQIPHCKTVVSTKTKTFRLFTHWN